MKRTMIVTAVIVMGAVLTLGSGQAFAGSGGSFEKLDYGDDLYGLPNMVTPSIGSQRTWDKLNYGDDLYGLPNVISPSPDTSGIWEKNYMGDDYRGMAALPDISS